MGVADIANVPGDDANSLYTWSFAHMAHHRDVNRVILQQHGVQIPEFELDPIDPKDMGVFLYQHQLMHNAANAVLQVSGNDLLDVDWKNVTERTSWIFLNQNEHLQWTKLLNV